MDMYQFEMVICFYIRFLAVAAAATAAQIKKIIL
jgi:hypothetical protein